MHTEDSAVTPAHYHHLPLEVMDIIKLCLAAANLPPFESYCFGNELKYRLRAGRKGDATVDIAKAEAHRTLRTGEEPSHG